MGGNKRPPILRRRMRQPPVTPGPRLVPFPPPLPFENTGPAAQIGVARPVLVESEVKRQTQPARTLQLSEALAHDARNALTALRLIAGMLGAPGILQAKDMHLAEQLHGVEYSLTQLVERFAALGSVRQSVPAAAEPAKTAGEAVLRCLPMLQASAGSRTVVHASAESGLHALTLEDDDLLRVLTNLVKNAAEAMPEGGTVRITARRALSLTQPAVLIHVSDDGPGIPAFALGQIFETGFSSKQGGAAPVGLGLAIVRELVENAGGKVRAASRRGRGTTFELRIPCRKSCK